MRNLFEICVLVEGSHEMRIFGSTGKAKNSFGLQIPKKLRIARREFLTSSCKSKLKWQRKSFTSTGKFK